MRCAGMPQARHTATALVEKALVKEGRGPTSTMAPAGGGGDDDDDDDDDAEGASAAGARKERTLKFSGSKVSASSHTSASACAAVRPSAAASPRST